MEEAARTGPSVVEAVDFDEAEGALVVSLRPKARERGRCRICRRHSPGYALGEGHRRRRTLDLGTTLCFLEAEAPRVECQTTGWSSARCRGRATTRSSRAARGPDRLACGQHLQDSGAGEVHSQLMRIAWRTVDWICARVMAEASAERGLRRIGVDEISVRRGQRYLLPADKRLS